jgi:hypothetical protein
MALNPWFPLYRVVHAALGLVLPCSLAGDAPCAPGAAPADFTTAEPTSTLQVSHEPASVMRAQATSACAAAPTTYAAHVKAQVSWPGNVALQGGRGTLHIWMKATLSFQGNTIAGTAFPCGNEIPDITATFVGGSKKLGTTVPPHVWNAPAMPRVPITGVQTGSDVGSTLSIHRSITLIGLSMKNPTGDWPASYWDITPVDSDGDGKPGITVLTKRGPQYQLPRLGILTSARADKIYVASRTIMSLSGKRDSCDTVSGPAVLERFDNHVVGCHVDGGTDCSADQTGFLDDNRVIFTTRAATFRAVKVAPTATCEDVRAAVP